MHVFSGFVPAGGRYRGATPEGLGGCDQQVRRWMKAKVAEVSGVNLASRLICQKPI
jgi:hypothetical protein